MHKLFELAVTVSWLNCLMRIPLTTSTVPTKNRSAWPMVTKAGSAGTVSSTFGSGLVVDSMLISERRVRVSAFIFTVCVSLNEPTGSVSSQRQATWMGS